VGGGDGCDHTHTQSTRGGRRKKNATPGPICACRSYTHTSQPSDIRPNTGPPPHRRPVDIHKPTRDAMGDSCLLQNAWRAAVVQFPPTRSTAPCMTRQCEDYPPPSPSDDTSRLRSAERQPQHTHAQREAQHNASSHYADVPRADRPLTCRMLMLKRRNVLVTQDDALDKEY
jgi:hypothetical protein